VGVLGQRQVGCLGGWEGKVFAMVSNVELGGGKKVGDAWNFRHSRPVPRWRELQTHSVELGWVNDIHFG